ncbi:hypothetical protein SD70_15985 [Gordoniibacillus kamchatkensis]|uniref:Uncharacterized protein n=1 Tax=Gordoniibacillus kamchatkensis TaxID=1590651 RepID=A0ABR5AG54_9BACL|nr:hypothetical protein [Paenibacillus sp. VKM B-2647]KIL40035.1 hypothetical protein SD70_15985 [Paenibacillus sp. VKM B-2647]
MRLRLLPIAISVAVSSVILFGGWFGYHSYAMENPLMNIVQGVPGVKDVQMNLKTDEVDVSLKLDPKAGSSLRQVYQAIETQGAAIVGKREVKVNVTNVSSEALERWWSSALFDVAQAMETKQYASIPKVLEQHKSELAGLSVSTEMDDQNVYVQMTQGDKSKYVILPRTGEKMVVWQNG